MNALEDRLDRAGDELRHAADEMTTVQVRGVRPVQRAIAFAVGVAAVLLLIAIPAWLLSGGEQGDVAADTVVEGDTRTGTVFMLPGFVPDGLRLASASLVDVNQRSTSDLDDTAGVVLQYLPEGQLNRQVGKPWLHVLVTDRLATLAAGRAQDDLQCFADDGTEVECYEGSRSSACTGDPAMTENRMDPEACMNEAEGRTAESFGGTDVDFQRATVRDLPAHIIRVTGSDFDVSITTYEGGPVLSAVTGAQIDEELLLRVANELRAVGAEEFDEATSRPVAR